MVEQDFVVDCIIIDRCLVIITRSVPDVDNFAWSEECFGKFSRYLVDVSNHSVLIEQSFSLSKKNSLLGMVIQIILFHHWNHFICTILFSVNKKYN